MTRPRPGDVPLSLYVHIPWCLRKCPYCDFNSHEVKGGLPERAYVRALLADLEVQVPRTAGRPLQSIFIGGGTPSLFSGAAITGLLEGIAARLPLAAEAEITLEANPGAVDAAHFAAYREAGVNRLSIGVQSFSGDRLQALGRVHDPAQARDAFHVARKVGFDNINLDLMFGLPGQSEEGALDDLRQALELAPEHLSWYQLTIEPNTLFHHRPPPLPDEGRLVAMQEVGQALLVRAGYAGYEISAHAREEFRCRHNLNYWRFGDYLGVGAGAHGKLTREDGVHRYWRPRHPDAYMKGADRQAGERRLSTDDLRLEFMMNALRLNEGVSLELFRARTGLDEDSIAQALELARQRGLMEDRPDRLQPTARGRRFLNDLLSLFLG